MNDEEKRARTPASDFFWFGVERLAEEMISEADGDLVALASLPSVFTLEWLQGKDLTSDVSLVRPRRQSGNVRCVCDLYPGWTHSFLREGFTEVEAIAHSVAEVDGKVYESAHVRLASNATHSGKAWQP